MAGTSTTQARIEVDRHNVEIVRAEASLKGEREVSRIRLVVQGMRLVAFPTMLLLTGQSLELSWARVLILAAYTLFTLVTFLGVRRTTPSVRRAEVLPLVVTVLDIAFIGSMSLTAASYDRELQTEMAGIGLALVLAFSTVRANHKHVAVAVGLAMAAYLGVALLQWRNGIYVSPVAVMFVIVTYGALGRLMVYLSQQVGTMFVDLRRRDNLSRFLPKQIVDRVLSLDDTALLPMKREVTVLFSDIRDFTSLSEKMDPKALLDLLDFYFGHMSQIVKGREGIVNKFIGDGMLCFWGVPEKLEAHADAAVQAALDMRKKLEEINAQRTVAGEAPLRIGIGIHTGVVAAGMLGGQEYTVIGDAVNLASRIEGLTKVHQTDILVSETTWKQLGDKYPGTRCAEEWVKGREESVTVYALAPAPALAEVPARWIAP
jgi:adenylate cyclase